MFATQFSPTVIDDQAVELRLMPPSARWAACRPRAARARRRWWAAVVVGLAHDLGDALLDPRLLLAERAQL